MATIDATSDTYKLGDLLAIIHRDGGHYQGEHGTSKAVEDAISIVCQQRELIDELCFDRNRWLNIVDRLKGELVAARCDEKTFNLAERLLRIAREQDSSS